jgi:hypothetical protein
MKGNGSAANETIFYVSLIGNGTINDNGITFAAKRTGDFIFDCHVLDFITKKMEVGRTQSGLN